MEYRLLCEDVLVKLLKADDESAFKEIYTRYWKELYKTAFSKTKSHTVAEEAVQNIFVKLWQNRATSSISYLENYLQTAVKYQVINYYKSLVTKENYLKNLNANPQAENTSATKLLVHELNALIDKAMQQLPQKTQEIFNLSRNEEFTVKQISEVMQLSEKAVEYHITKSLKQLRIHLKEIISFIAFVLIAFFH